MPKLGRPRSLDDSKKSTAAFLRSIGLPIKAIARWLHCAPSTLRREMQREADFRRQMDSACDGLETEIIESIVRAASTQPGAAKWLRNRYLKIIEGQERLLRGLKHKRPPSFGYAGAQKSRRTDRSSDSPTPENADKTNLQARSVRCQPQSPFSRTAQNAADSSVQNSKLQPGPSGGYPAPPTSPSRSL